MNKNTKKYVRLSLFLHLSPLLLCLHIPGCGESGVDGGGGHPPPPPNKKPGQEEKIPGILDIPKSVDVDTVTEADLNGYKKIIKKRFTPRECPAAWYGGIGVQYNSEENPIINAVPSAYPAAKAGIEVGDVMVGDTSDYRGDVGKEVTAIIRKPDGRIKNYTMLREKICLEKKESN